MKNVWLGSRPLCLSHHESDWRTHRFHCATCPTSRAVQILHQRRQRGTAFGDGVPMTGQCAVGTSDAPARPGSSAMHPCGYSTLDALFIIMVASSPHSLNTASQPCFGGGLFLRDPRCVGEGREIFAPPFPFRSSQHAYSRRPVSSPCYM